MSLSIILILAFVSLLLFLPFHSLIAFERVSIWLSYVRVMNRDSADKSVLGDVTCYSLSQPALTDLLLTIVVSYEC